jgi:hypothetical protein
MTKTLTEAGNAIDFILERSFRDVAITYSVP